MRAGQSPETPFTLQQENSLGTVFRKHQDWFDENDKEIQGLLEEKYQKQKAFFTPDVYNNHNLWSCQKVCDALVCLLGTIFIRFGTKLYR